MLKKEANESLCRVGPGTPMGNLMRRYWIPAIYPGDLPERDGPPVRLRLLGEDLVAFRDSDGQVGLFAAACPHRGASLFFGRNEESGLRCVYHGWKFDVAGNCVDMPSEPAESNFKSKVHATAYPTIERGGVIWGYMGPRENQPAELPAFMSNLVPDSNVHVIVRVQESNYLQALEGGYDSVHTSFLHTRLTGPRNAQINTPRMASVDTDFGVMIGACRAAAEAGKAYWRANLFLFPFYHMSPGGVGPEAMGRWSAWVPIDDENTLRWIVAWQNDRPMTDADLEPYRTLGASWNLLTPEQYAPSNTLPGGRWRTLASKANDYLIDREKQRTQTYTGVADFLGQDQVVTESMGGILDRTVEHLATTDLGIIAVRRRLLRAVEALANHNEDAPGAHNPDAFTVRSGSAMLSVDADWVEGLHDSVYLRAPSEGVQLAEAPRAAAV